MTLIQRSSRSFSRRTVDYSRPALQTPRRSARGGIFDRPTLTRNGGLAPRAQDARR